MTVSRGFTGRRRDDGSGRVPPGQYRTDDFPVLSAGPTPRTPLDEWDFTIVGEVDEPLVWTWDELRALPSETPTVVQVSFASRQVTSTRTLAAVPL